MVGERASDGGSTEERTALVHRESFQLVALMAVAVAAFLVTRAVASSNRDMNHRDAAEWYRRGQQSMQAGHLDDAIESLRRATVRNRDDRQYVLALAQALARNHDDDAARSVLLTLRDADPEDRDVNLQLARLAASRQDLSEAVRFYHNALYAPWPLDQVSARRQVRLELVRFLLARKQTGRAVAELLALSSDMPDEALLHIEVARLFAAANDDAHAVEQFQRAIALRPAGDAVVAEAGMAAFRLGDYARADSYLRRVPAADEDARRTREIVGLVLSRDPLAPHIGSAERRRRLAADLADTHERLRACVTNAGSNETLAALDMETQVFETDLAHTSALEQDTVEAGVDLVDRLDRALGERCAATTILDRALALIGRRHSSESR